MTGQEIMYAVLFILTLFGSVSGVWWRIEGKVKGAEDRADKAREDLSIHKLHVAEFYVTKAGMHEQTLALTRMIDAIGNKIDGLNERLDRVIENRPASRR